MKTPIRFFFTLLCAAIVSVQSVHAATFHIPDGNVTALIVAIFTSNANGEDDTIELATNGTYTLTVVNNIVNGQNGLPVILSDNGHKLVIHGNGATLQRSTAGGTLNFRIFYIGAGANVTISGLTITNGSASGAFSDNAGGGIYNDHATLMVTDSTLSGNSAGDFGGGIVNNSGLVGGSGATLTVNNSTLSGNSAFSEGGGIWNGFGLTLTIGSTILNAGASGENIFNEAGTVTSLGYNLSSDDASALLNQTTDQNSTDPKLGPLVDNGGPTFTHALCTASGVPDASCTGASPAIDQGKNFSGSATDQRGFFRTFDNFSIPNAPSGDGTDIGAFEVQATVCPEGQGFWKNNPAAWPASALPMTLGSQTYTTKSQLLKILKTPIKGNAVLILADQLIAAKLNIANANGTPVASTITNADSLLTGHPIGSHVKTSSSTGQAMVNDANVLDNYNNGVMTPGCGL